ncbi:carbohydrate ABC transporter permease [Alicyclobacillus tolerans]|uniref:Multiple sugar transport system permease protein n=1 Tax=Alicyclobacillus tolerans TaxID=90970 RepID=A0ABT9LXP1_9BACL|nr:sugar ABC transporter permease [Alicyclobacillus tengchongensis]MDP9729037.1 multiple sugar transport system permease protein [Alicyclobacillus tengchongensis]
MAQSEQVMGNDQKWRAGRKYFLRSDRNSGIRMMAPALLVILLVTLFPILYSVVMSFSHVAITDNGFQIHLQGFKNYNILIHSGIYWHSVWFTIYYALVTVFVELVLGMLIALAIHNVERLKSVSLVVMLIPWSLITVISAEMWSYIYNGVYGVLNYVLISLHILSSPVTWTGHSVTAIISMMVADIWKTTPFVVIILLGGLQMISKEYYEAAYMDGANRWQVFWKITFPLLRGSIALAAMFRVLQAFGVFDLPYVLTGGGPGRATQSLAMLADQALFTNLHFGLGSSVAVSTVVMVLVICLLFLSAFRSLVEEGA